MSDPHATRMFRGGAFDRYPFKLRYRIKTPGKLSDGRAAILIQHPFLGGRELPPEATARGRSALASVTAPCSVPPRPEPALFWLIRLARTCAAR
jgi:hypothetical protein